MMNWFSRAKPFIISFNLCWDYKRVILQHCNWCRQATLVFFTFVFFHFIIIGFQFTLIPLRFQSRVLSFWLSFYATPPNLLKNLFTTCLTHPYLNKPPFFFPLSNIHTHTQTPINASESNSGFSILPKDNLACRL